MNVYGTDLVGGGEGTGGWGKGSQWRLRILHQEEYTYKMVYSKDAGLRGLFYVEAPESRTHVFIYGGHSNITT